MKKLRFRYRKLIFQFVCGVFCFNLFAGLPITAFETEPQQIIETENEALESSRKWSGQSYRRSIGLYLDSARKWSERQEYARASDCLRQAARLYFLLGDFQTSKLQIEKALEIDKKNNNSAGQAKSLSFLSLVYLEENERSQSESAFQKAIELSVISGDTAAQAAARMSAAEYSYFYADADTTVKLYEEVRQLGEKSGDRRLLAQILLNLSYAYCKQGKANLGLKTAQHSLAEWQAAKDERGQAITFTAMGLAYKMLDEGQNALNAYQTTEAMFPTDMDLIERARLATGTGSVYALYNYNSAARDQFQKAYDLFKQANYPGGQLDVLPTLIKYTYATNDSAAAESFYDEVKILTRKFNNDLFLAYTNEIMGNESLKNGFKDEAVRQYSDALRIFQKYKNKKGAALLYQRLGEAFESKGDFSPAAENFNHALAINHEIKDNFGESEALYRLARLDMFKGHDGNALKLIKNSIHLTENLTSDIVNTKLKSAYFSNVFDRYGLYINLLMKLHKESGEPSYMIEALRAAEKSRARVLLENLLLAQADFTRDAEPETIESEKEIRVLLNSKADKLTDLLSRDADRSETEKLSSEIRELENKLENLRAQLRLQSPVYSAIRNPAAFDVADFQQNVLDENSLLLEFSMGTNESYLWLIGKTEVEAFVLPPRAEIASQLKNLRESLNERGLKEGESVEDFQARLNQAEKTYRDEAQNLSRRLFGPLAGKLKNKRLIIVPDGELHYFPIAALPLPDSETDEPLLLTNETIYEPSAQTLAILAKSRKQPASSAKNLLVFSDPIFTKDDARLSPENQTAEKLTAQATPKDSYRFVESLNNLPRLAASKDESETIVNIIGASNADSFSGFEATRENLLNLKAGDYKIIHFATHGLTDETRPELSGIVLSRFDEKGRRLNELIRIQDIYGLNLNADLVVLSACETGIGKELRGEGLLSLNNAFLQTGAKSVMASLWKVEDGATLELMKNFYGALIDEELTPSESLRRAQIKLRANPRYKSPFYWAAFTVQGDFRNAPKMAESPRFWGYLLLLLPLSLIGFYLFRRRKYRLKARPSSI